MSRSPIIWLPVMSLVAACDGTTPELVAPPRTDSVATVTVSPSSRAMSALGDTVIFTATASNTAGIVLQDVLFTWTSSDPAVAQTDSVGRVVAVGNGAATITVTAEGVSDSGAVTVMQTVAAIEATPDSTVLWPGDTTRLAASPVDRRGHPVAGRTVTWTLTPRTTFATVTSDGLVTAVGDELGPVRVMASVDGKADTARVGVLVSYAAIAAGERMTCGISTREAAYCWGSGGLGDDRATPSAENPVRVSGERRFVAITVGAQACASTGASALYCWSGDAVSPPMEVGAGLAFVTVDAGPYHICGLVASGAAYCWGNNTNGALGDGTAISRSSPVAVTGGLSFTSIGVGNQYTCGAATDGATYCWGYISPGPNAMYAQLTPLVMPGTVTLAALSAGDVACGLESASQAAYCWMPIAEPQPVTGGIGFARVSVGGGHRCGITSGGTAYCWGRNDDGELGDGTAVGRNSPTRVTGGLKWAVLSAGADHVCGVTTTGAAYCWGNNSQGQLGDGTHFRRANPMLVIGSRP